MDRPSIDIVFDSSQKIFMPGESISGSVRFLRTDNLRIEIYFCGEYYYYKNDKEFVDAFMTESCPLVFRGAGDGSQETSFSFVVRPDSPASIATPLGGIRYRLYASLFSNDSDQKGQSDSEKSEYLNIIVPRRIKEGLSGKKEHLHQRNLLSCCLGTLSGDLEVTKASLLCGHSAVINACIINRTNSYVLMTSLSLVQKIERRKDGKILTNKVASKERGCILPRKRQVWLSEKFLIPPLPPSGSDVYFIVSYKFVMEIQKSVTKTLKIKIPIAIGNIPPDQEKLPITWNDPTAGTEFWCSIIEDSIKDVGFRPLYVSYITP